MKCETAYSWLRYRLTGRGVPPVGRVRFGDFRRTEPISRSYGYDRGRPVDRYYIENFLKAHGDLITGHVLEIGERTYTSMFGRDVVASEMLHVSNEGDATYVDDLTDGWSIPSNRFDCIILTQTLHLIYDMKSALKTIYRILRPGGTLLCTVPGITQISDEEWNDRWYWALTSNSARKLTEQVFPPGYVKVDAYGNVLAAICFLQGLSNTELTPSELDVVDPEYQVTITIAARTADSNLVVPMGDRWNYDDANQFPYDEETSYRLGMEFLDGHGEAIEDWGCGTAFAKRFVTTSAYVGIDGSKSDFADVKADLQTHHSGVDCIFMRHVLEHNWGWRAILANAVGSFRKRMVLVIFIPFGESELRLDEGEHVPDLQLNREEVLAFFDGLQVREEQIKSATQYGTETIFFVEK